ncbi:hypothetical protein KA005_23200, partial [bacterium]|nr:hypothetical protein [bacterium]
MSKKLLYVFACLVVAFYAVGAYCEEFPQNENLLQENEVLNAPESKHLIYKSKLEEEKIGLIESITENEVMINLGRNLHVTPSMEFKVFRKEKRIEIPEEGESNLFGEYYIATLKVVKANDEKSSCKVIHIEPTDNIMVTDKVVSVPGTGYEEMLKQRETDKRALEVFWEAKKASRSKKESAIELYKKIISDFPQSAYLQVAQEEIDRYERIADNSVYQFKRIHSFCPGKNDKTSLSKDIAVDSIGNVWLLNSPKVQLEKYSMFGEPLITLKRKNKYDREIMRSPSNITLDKDDNIYVLDPGLKKVSKFDKNGNFINDYAPKKSQKPLVKPIDIAVNSNQDVFILDAGTSNVHAFTKDNK